MAKKSMIAREVKRKKTVAKYAAKKAELKATFMNLNASDEERSDAYKKLQKLPRNASASRVVRRCSITGISPLMAASLSLIRLRPNFL